MKLEKPFDEYFSSTLSHLLFPTFFLLTFSYRYQFLFFVVSSCRVLLALICSINLNLGHLLSRSRAMLTSLCFVVFCLCFFFEVVCYCSVYLTSREAVWKWMTTFEIQWPWFDDEWTFLSSTTTTSKNIKQAQGWLTYSQQLRGLLFAPPHNVQHLLWVSVSSSVCVALPTWIWRDGRMKTEQVGKRNTSTQHLCKSVIELRILFKVKQTESIRE